MKVTYSEHTYYEEKISASPVLIDLGSCRGDFAKHFMSKYDNATIVMVEPSRKNFLTISSNPLFDSENVTKHFLALSVESGKTVSFHEDMNSEQNGSFLFKYFIGDSYDILTISLDDIVKNFERVDLVKMDIEGAEWDCLMNTSDETLAKISQITVEFHDFLDPSLRTKTDSAVKRLLDFGYKLEHSSTTWMHGSEYYDSLFYK